MSFSVLNIISLYTSLVKKICDWSSNDSWENINSIIVITVIISHGIVALIIGSSLSPVTLAAAYKQTPTGGVISPKDNAITKKTTKNIGSIPIVSMAGNKIGINIYIAAVASINIPTIIKKPKINSITTIGLVDIEVIMLPTVCGRPSSSNIKAAGFAVIAINKMEPVDLAVRLITSGI